MRVTVIVLATALGLTAAASQELIEMRCPPTSGIDWCAHAQEQARAERAAFRRGEYTAMRNRAFCLWSGCDGAFVRDQAASCKIRREIMRRHVNLVGRGDEAHFVACHNRGY